MEKKSTGKWLRRRFKDVPDGTITKQPCFSDLMIALAMK